MDSNEKDSAAAAELPTETTETSDKVSDAELETVAGGDLWSFIQDEYHEFKAGIIHGFNGLT